VQAKPCLVPVPAETSPRNEFCILAALDVADVRRLGLGLLVLTTAVVLLAIPYWEWLGLPWVGPHD
jgi:hypothetical protein